MIGVVLISVGSPFYGVLAYNMAVSIRLKSDVPITLLADEQSLAKLMPNQREVFTEIIFPPYSDYSEKGILNPLKLKTRIYDYSPYDSTLYLDVDGLFLGDFREFDDLIKELKDFQIHEVKRHKFPYDKVGMIWTRGKDKVQHLPEILKEYKVKAPYPEYNSSFIWFKKSEKNEKYFSQVKENYDNKHQVYTQLGTLYPDELAWNLASAQLKHYGKKDGYRPIYFNWEDEIAPLPTIASLYFFLGMAAGYQPGKLLGYYNGIARANCSKIGHKWSRDFDFQMKNKLYFKK